MQHSDGQMPQPPYLSLQLEPIRGDGTVGDAELGRGKCVLLISEPDYEWLCAKLLSGGGMGPKLSELFKSIYLMKKPSSAVLGPWESPTKTPS